MITKKYFQFLLFFIAFTNFSISKGFAESSLEDDDSATINQYVSSIGADPVKGIQVSSMGICKMEAELQYPESESDQDLVRNIHISIDDKVHEGKITNISYDNYFLDEYIRLINSKTCVAVQECSIVIDFFRNSVVRIGPVPVYAQKSKANAEAFKKYLESNGYCIKR